jgi:hypothetical protein
MHLPDPDEMPAAARQQSLDGLRPPRLAGVSREKGRKAAKKEGQVLPGSIPTTSGVVAGCSSNADRASMRA